MRMLPCLPASEGLPASRATDGLCAVGGSLLTSEVTSATDCGGGSLGCGLRQALYK